MINYNAEEIKESLNEEQIFQLLINFGGNPQRYTNYYVSETICHNPPGQGSNKLYYYFNTKIFHCYTGCENSSFDLFHLVIKIQEIQFNRIITFRQAIEWVAQYFGFAGKYIDNDETTIVKDWATFKQYEKIKEKKINKNLITLKNYDPIVLQKFNYKINITPWLKEFIAPEIIKKTNISYYPGEEQIIIPHYDINNNLIGVRGRNIVQNDIERLGKYRPIKINQTLYSHPLGLNLYGINWAKDNIKILKKAIVFESEKSVLQYMTFMGFENTIALASCGSSFSMYQFQLLQDLKVEEIIIAFDKDFEEINDKIFQKQVKILKGIHNRFSPYTKISFIFDKNNNILPAKSSPTDLGKEIFFKLFKERILL